MRGAALNRRLRLGMADLQAEIELTVELRKFVNIDLFVQG